MPNILTQVIQRFTVRQFAVIAIGVVAAAGLWGVSRWIAAPRWVPLFPSLALESVGDVTSRLDDAGIAYRLERGGTSVTVAEPELARARVLLAREGLPTGGRPGFELFDQPSWGMSDFTQRVNYRRALEGELERTIGNMRGVESAQVHLAMHESKAFGRNERPAEASVVLRLRNTGETRDGLVEGVASLVASSVDGLLSENVTVLDDEGHVLTASVEQGSAAGATRRHLALRREVESYLESKAEELVTQLVGPGNVRVRVAAQLDFNRVDRTVQVIDPEQRVVTTEEKSEIIPGAEVTGAASKTSRATYEHNRRVETISSGTGEIERLTVAVLVNHAERQTEDGPVLEPRTPDELERIGALVGNAVGLDPDRGDQVSVETMAFNTVEPVVADDSGPGFLDVVRTFQGPILGLLGILLAFFIALQAVRAATRMPATRRERRPRAGEHALPSGFGEQHEPTGREVAVASVMQQPEAATRLVRSWIREG